MTIYYVSPNGSDSNNGLSPSSPFSRISTAMGKVIHGDTIKLMEGTYYEKDIDMIPGIEGSPITLTSYNPSNPAFIRAPDSEMYTGGGITLSDYNIVDNVKVYYTEHGIGTYGKYGIVRNCDIGYTGGAASGTGWTSSYSLFENNEFHHPSQITKTDPSVAANTFQFGGLLYPGNPIDHTIIRGNYFHHTEFKGHIDMLGRTSNTLIEGNCFDSGDYSIWQHDVYTGKPDLPNITHENLVVRNNKFSTNNAMLLYGFGDTRIGGNYFNNTNLNGNTIFLYGSSGKNTGVVVIGNNDYAPGLSIRYQNCTIQPPNATDPNFTEPSIPGDTGYTPKFECYYLPTSTPCGVDTGSLDVSSSPSGATIYLDSININKITPQTINGIAVGTHHLLLRLTGYNDYEKDIVIQKDITTTEISTLTPTTPKPTESPVGYWNFNETVVGTAFDSSGNAYDGTDNNTSIVTSKSGFGNARSFNGSSSYVDIGAKSGLAITDELTISALIKTTDTKEQVIVGRTILGKHAWALATTGGKGYFWVATGYGVYGTDIITGSILVNDGNWHTIVVRWTGAALELYVDGKLDVSAPKNTKPTYDTSQIVHIGSFPYSNGISTDYFNGAIDEVKIYNKAIAIEIPPPPPPSVTPVGYWKFEESVVGTAIDSSDNHNNGTEYNVSIVPSKTGFGNALSFNGSTSYINIGTSNSLTIVDELTISALIKTTDTKEQVIVGRTISGKHAWVLGTSNGNAYFAVANGYGVWTEDVITGSVVINDGHWHTVVGIWTGKDIKLYVDGSLDISAPKTSKPTYDTSQIVRIGNFIYPNGTNFAYFNGIIDDVKIYNKAIAIEIPPPTVSPVGYWTFDNDISDLTAIDSSGNGNNGTKWDTTKVDSKSGFGKALSFNGSTSAVYINEQNNTLTITDKLTLSALIKTSATKDQIIVGRSMSGQHAWALGTSGRTAFFWVATGYGVYGTDIITGSIVVNDDKWHTVVGRWTGEYIELYVDGTLDISKPKTSKPTSNTNQKVRIGNFPLTSTTSSAYFNGIIDDVKIYNDAV